MKFENKRIVKYLFLTVLTFGFYETYAMDLGPSFLYASAHRFIKEQISDHRLTSQDVADIEAISIQMNRQEPIVDEINRSESKVDITLRWDLKTKTYTLEQKDKEWLDACRDFDTMTRMNPHIAGFERLDEASQTQIINYFRESGNRTDERAMLISLWPDFFSEMSKFS